MQRLVGWNVYCSPSGGDRDGPHRNGGDHRHGARAAYRRNNRGVSQIFAVDAKAGVQSIKDTGHFIAQRLVI